jgi:hypothetical protein
MESVRRFPNRTNTYYTMAVRCNNDASKLNTAEAVSFKDLSNAMDLFWLRKRGIYLAILVLKNVIFHDLV